LYAKSLTVPRIPATGESLLETVAQKATGVDRKAFLQYEPT
jgi:hypothetical protein